MTVTRLYSASGLLALLAVAGCSEYGQGTPTIGRDTAKAAVLKALASEYENVPKERMEPYSDCIVDNATRLELTGITAGSVAGPTPQVVETIDNIIARPATAQCITQAALG